MSRLLRGSRLAAVLADVMKSVEQR